MYASLFINGSHDPSRTNFVSWSPSPCQVNVNDASGAAGSVPVILRNQRTDVGGQVVFFAARGAPALDTLDLMLPADGTPIDLLVAGKFPHASTENLDAAIDVVNPADQSVIGSVRLMVRIRKDANTMLDGERDRFIDALGQLNARGLGRFSEFRAMHNADVEEEAHRRSGFLAWHRAYLLDLERELQAIDPSVALPYWRFDQPAPRLFSPEFIGVTSGFDTVVFSSSNPLQFWRTDNENGITRRPLFNTTNQAANSPPWGEPILTEADTIALGDAFADFRALESNPHGYAHTSFEGVIDDPATAPRDPLFFLLHCNVDRLWAKWQWLNHRHDVNLGTPVFVPSDRIGHHLDDTMWPWNGDRTPPRPTSPAPGGGFASSPILSFPGSQPRVRDSFDYQGLFDPAVRLDFDYDDVPFEWPTP